MKATDLTCACGAVIELPVSIGVVLSQVTGPCCDCGRPATDAPDEKVIFPWAWACGPCFEANPRQVWKSSENHTCDASLTVQALSQCVVSKAPKTVPHGEFWAQGENGIYMRHTILSNGTTREAGKVRTKT